MATILPFVVRPRPVLSGHKGDAAIIIFPGVRYESVEFATSTQKKTGGGGKRPTAQKGRKRG